MLRLKSTLDRETIPAFTVSVLAIDSGTSPLTSTATVSVIVQDINDNSPVFLPYNTEYQVPENASEGTVVARISATDDDLEEFGLVVYTFDVSNDDNKLAINRTSVSPSLVVIM